MFPLQFMFPERGTKITLKLHAGHVCTLSFNHLYLKIHCLQLLIYELES